MLNDIPAGARYILNHLNEHGYQAYLVGGCVRDLLTNKTPHDWDICTDATPGQMLAVFNGFRCIETGLQHGTITISLEDGDYEVTTFRADGEYSDGRHPDNVVFVKSLYEDLSRRDFTVNAMAISKDGKVIDPFGGQTDIKLRTIRCVGLPEDRFKEDWLRIMRAMRFSSGLGYYIDPDTLCHIQSASAIPPSISAERIQSELRKMIVGNYIYDVAKKCKNIFFLAIPQLRELNGFCQHNPYHQFDIWEHTIRSVDRSEPNEVVRLAMLFHDIAKPSHFILDSDGIGHFYGHAEAGSIQAEKIMRTLKFDNKTTSTVSSLVKLHDYQLPSSKPNIRRFIRNHGWETTKYLFMVKAADIMAQRELCDLSRLQCLINTKKRYEDVYNEAPALSVKDLRINGNDLIKLGFCPGPNMGMALNTLLQLVIDDFITNEYESLAEHALSILKTKEIKE